MNKNWLIRTKNNHILGPVSREKIKELIGNGSIKGDDEICAGNGYWIYVREQDLVARYILEGEVQPFNPVQEAEAVLALSPMQDDLEYPEERDKLPSDEDLDYPEESQIDITAIDMKLESLQSPAEEVGDVELEPESEQEQEKKKNIINKPLEMAPAPKLRKRAKKTAPVQKENTKKSLLGGDVLILILAILSLALAFLLYNRSDFIKTLMKMTQIHAPVIPTAHAQVNPSKKKNGIPKNKSVIKIFEQN